MKNFLLRFLLPPAYALGLLIIVGMGATNGFDDITSLAVVCMLYAPGVVWFAVLSAYSIAGLPALGFAILMGRLQRRGFRHGGVRLLAAALLGLVAGLLVAFQLGIRATLVFVPLGLVVGLMIELTVVMLERRGKTELI